MQMECTEPPRGAFVLKNVVQDAVTDALLRHTRSHACSSVKSVVPSACVCLRVLMGTNNTAHATTTGRPREEAPNALKIFNSPNCFHLPNYIFPCSFFSCSLIKLLSALLLPRI